MPFRSKLFSHAVLLLAILGLGGFRRSPLSEMDQKEQLNPNLSVRDTFFVIWYGTILWFINNIDAFLYIQ
jgi:hypothetical protein